MTKRITREIRRFLRRIRRRFDAPPPPSVQVPAKTAAPAPAQAPTPVPIPNSRLIKLAGLPSFPIIVHPPEKDRIISPAILSGGQWESFETELFCRLAPLFDMFVDLGANIGWYSTIANLVMPPVGRIVAFEPDPDNFALLRKNASSSRTTLVRAGVSDRVGTMRLFHSEMNFGDHQLYEGPDARLSIDVQVTTLDTYFHGAAARPALVKMDTQGSEPRIFRKGGPLLSPEARSSAFIVEFWPHGIANSGEDVDCFVDDLARFPHRPFIIDHPTRKLREVSWQTLRERVKADLTPSSMHFVDLLMVVPGSPAHLAVADYFETAPETALQP